MRSRSGGSPSAGRAKLGLGNGEAVSYLVQRIKERGRRQAAATLLAERARRRRHGFRFSNPDYWQTIGATAALLMRRFAHDIPRLPEHREKEQTE
jgi:hypothetical protein